MQRKFIFNLILVIAVNLLIKPIYIFGIELNVQNLIGAENYGLYYSLFNLTYIFSFILDPGITNYNNRNISQNVHLLDKNFSNISLAKSLLSILYIIILFVYGIVSNIKSDEWLILFMLMLSQIFNSFTLYNRSNIAGLHLFKTDTFLSIIDKLTLILLCVPFLYFEHYKSSFTLNTFVLLQCISFFISSIISFFVVLFYAKKFQFKFNFKLIFVIIKQSLPYALLTLLMLIYSKADTVIIKEIHTDGNLEVGFYAAAYRLIDAMNMIAVLFAGLLYPIFSKSIKNKENLNNLVSTSFAILVIPSTLIAITGIFYSSDIIALLYHENIKYSSTLFSTLLIAFIFICNSYIFGTYLTALGKIKLLNRIAFYAVIFNILLNIILSSKFGAISACVISTMTFAAVSLLHSFFSVKKLNIIIPFNKLLSFFALITISIVLNYLLSKSFLDWYISAIFGLIMSILSIFIVRLVSINQVFKLIKPIKL